MYVNNIDQIAKKSQGFLTEVLGYLKRKWENRKEDTIPSTANGKLGFFLKLVNFMRYTIMPNGGARVAYVTN